jgi:hypothetical protein
MHSLQHEADHENSQFNSSNFQIWSIVDHYSVVVAAKMPSNTSDWNWLEQTYGHFLEQKITYLQDTLELYQFNHAQDFKIQ